MAYNRAAMIGMAVCGLFAFLGLQMLRNEGTEALGAAFFPTFMAAAVAISALGWRPAPG